MSDYIWPPTVKPLTSRNYSFGRGNGVFQTAVGGGRPRSARNLSLDTPTFNLNFLLSRVGYQVVNSFFNNQLNGGANTFTINLDSGSGIEPHVGVIQANTWNVTIPSDGVYSLSFSFIVEYVPSQLVEDCPNLVDLYSCYGENLCSVLNNLDDLVENFL